MTRPVVEPTLAVAGEWRVPPEWAAAARVGVDWAVRVVGIDCTTVEVTSIRGLYMDTNPVLVAVAAAQGTWALLQYEPDAELLHRLEGAVRTSWDRGPASDPAEALRQVWPLA